MLVRVEDGLQKVHKIGGRSVRCYTITTRILSGLDVENGATDVTGVTKGFFEGATTSQTLSDFKRVSSVTQVTAQAADEDGARDGDVDGQDDNPEIQKFLDHCPQAGKGFRPRKSCTQVKNETQEDKGVEALNEQECDHCHQPGAEGDPLLDVFDGESDTRLHHGCLEARKVAN
jgi:hypothetical protein